MTKKQIVDLGIDESIAEIIVQRSKESLRGFVPRERFNEVNEARKKAQEQLMIFCDIAKEKENLLEQLETMRGESKSLEVWYEEQLAKSRLDKAIYLGLSRVRAKNLRAVYALLNLDVLSLGSDGGVVGLDEQIARLVEADDSKFLFAKDDKLVAWVLDNV